jgi:glycosyltransferase involved in cell wall biosynthesis
LLLISGAYQISGGIAAVNRMVLRALDALGYQSSVLSLCETSISSQLLPEFIQARYRCFRNQKRNFSIAAWKEILANKWDLILVDQINIASALAPLSLLGKCNYLVWLHGIEVFPPRPDFEGRLGLKFAQLSLANSRFTRDTVLARYPSLPVKVCDLALETSDLGMSSSSKPGFDRKIELVAVDGSIRELAERVILNVGRMHSHTRYKGQDELLLAFPAISAQYPDGQLVLAGDGDDRARIIEVARSLPAELHHRIFIPGFVSPELLDQLYRECYLFAMPSSGEGFGLVYLEAMARGKPCLGSRQDAAQCVIRDGETGLLVDDPRSVQEVAEKVLFLLQNQELVVQMGRSGYELVKSRYLFQHFMQRFSQVIQ